ncbi:Fungal specific transcription factor domain [Rhizoctonia solani]|uniref:Fungal specific transcription factor domain n=1 Tax=Rhizoctonia solani TaxID=456999 RepID=A0A8H8P7Q4_9AGAM|nr:Fungal specific transcription factor domain [Rhizoctonia solani]QRW26085.1 Fungal specific transcription factor domain [Rhizoctonia solani]
MSNPARGPKNEQDQHRDPQGEQAKKLAKQQASLAQALSLTDNSLLAPDRLAGSFDSRHVPSLGATPPLGAHLDTTLYELAMMPSLNLTSYQPTLLASFSPENNDFLSQEDHSTHTLTYSLPSSNENLRSLDLPSLYCPPDPSSSLYIHKSENVEDLEGVGEIVCRTPLGLDRMVDSNSLIFVLYAYSQWILLAVFDPLQIIHTSQETIINQFLDSSASRCRLILISELMMRLIESQSLDEGGKRMLALLEGEICRNIVGYQTQQKLLSQEERRRAITALDHLLLSIRLFSAPLAPTLHLLQLTAPVFLSTCSLPHPPDMSMALLDPSINLRHFVVMDVVTSITTVLDGDIGGHEPRNRYRVPWSLDLCGRFTRTREDQGLQWMFGIPDQFILLLGYMTGLRDDADTTGIPTAPRVIEQIEEDMRSMIILPCEGGDASLTVARMIVQACWRGATFIYLYMALCGADAFDPRVMRAQRGFMKLVNGTRPGRNPDTFLLFPMLISTHRQTIISRILTTPHFMNPNTTGNDYLRMLEDIWARTNSEGRAARWEDLREACVRITGI